MVNLYKLLNVLEQGMSLFQLNKWKTEGLWYPITQYKKESDEIQVVTNLFIADQEQYHIQLSGNYPEEFDDWNKFLEENQWKIYPITCKHNASLLAHRELPIILYSISTGIHIHNR